VGAGRRGALEAEGRGGCVRGEGIEGIPVDRLSDDCERLLNLAAKFAHSTSYHDRQAVRVPPSPHFCPRLWSFPTYLPTPRPFALFVCPPLVQDSPGDLLSSESLCCSLVLCCVVLYCAVCAALCSFSGA